MPRVMVSGILTKEQVERGYRVVEEGDRFVELWWYSTFVAVFSATGPSQNWAIQQAADQHWVVR